MSIGLVCPRCDGLAEIAATACAVCGAALIDDADIDAAASPGRGMPMGGPTSGFGKVKQPSGATRPPQEASAAMISCSNCGHQMPPGDKFCGQCGNRIESEAAKPAMSGKTMFFSGVQMPGRAKLILVRGDSTDGISYQLNGTEHVAGREEGAILFPEDPLVSPRHANFYYKEDKLHVRDEGSVNGVFIRIKRPVTLASGSVFLVGEQLLQIEAVAPDLGPQPDSEGTYFYASPRRASKMKLIQTLRGGEIGLIYRARAETLAIGRENCDVNFPDDPFISGMHAQLNILEDGNFKLEDLGSKNGTFVRIDDEVPLLNGDYVFLGQQLLRVEIS